MSGLCVVDDYGDLVVVKAHAYITDDYGDLVHFITDDYGDSVLILAYLSMW